MSEFGKWGNYSHTRPSPLFKHPPNSTSALHPPPPLTRSQKGKDCYHSDSGRARLQLWATAPRAAQLYLGCYLLRVRLGGWGPLEPLTQSRRIFLVWAGARLSPAVLALHCAPCCLFIPITNTGRSCPACLHPHCLLDFLAQSTLLYNSIAMPSLAWSFEGADPHTLNRSSFL